MSGDVSVELKGTWSSRLPIGVSTVICCASQNERCMCTLSKRALERCSLAQRESRARREPQSLCSFPLDIHRPQSYTAQGSSLENTEYVTVKGL